MLEPLESRTFFSIDTSSVALLDVNGQSAKLDRSRPTWLVIHGIGQNSQESDMADLGTATQAAVPGSQVLMVDWSQLSHSAPDNQTYVQRAWAVADLLASKIRAAKIKGKNVNLLGFSMGGEVQSRLAKDLNGINRQIAIDPAAPNLLAPDPVTGKLLSTDTTYSKYSKFSVSFYGSSYFQGSTSANHTIEMLGLTGDNLTQHAQTELAVITMLRRNVGFDATPASDHISSIFSIQNILNGTLPAWKPDSYHGILSPQNVYEAELTVGPISGAPGSVEPRGLKYLNLQGTEISI